mgnify:CR=1 FL=1
MISFLCDGFMDVALPILILAVGFTIAIVVYIALKKRGLPDKNIALKVGKGKPEVELNKCYITAEEMKILEYVHKALPKDFIAFPRVGVNQIVSPTKNLVAYNSILSKYLDICVFYRKTMEPLLVIDLQWDNEIKQQFKVMDNNVVAVLNAVKLKVVPIKVEPAYDIAELRKKLLSALPDKMIAMLKKDYIDGESKEK